MNMNEDKDELRHIQSFLEEENHFLDVDGVRLPVKDLIDSVLEQDGKKRRYSIG